MNEELKVLDGLRKLCVSVMLLVDDFVEAHKDILVASLRKEFDIPTIGKSRYLVIAVS